MSGADFVVNVVEENVSGGDEPVVEDTTITVDGVDVNTGATNGKFTVTAPSEVVVGETFEVVFQWTDYTFATGYTGAYSYNFAFDTRYAVLNTGTVADVNLVEATVAWEDASNYGTGATEATDKTAASMTTVEIGMAANEDDPGCNETFTVKVTFKAAAVGACSFSWADGYAQFCDSNVEEILMPDMSGADFVVNVVEEGGDTPVEPTTYTVKFVVDGTVVDTQTVEEGAAATAPADPTKVGYTFAGWDVAFDNITADTTVTAKWTINTYTVKFVIDGATVSEQTVEHGAAATAPATDKVGYTFSGWDKAFNNITADTTVSGSYTIKSYTVTFVDGFGNTVDTQTVNHGAAATAPADPVVEGQTFKGWDKAFNNITADTTVTATWEGNSYTVQFVIDGTVVDTQTVAHGGAASAPATDKEGYTFSGWDKAFDNITADTTVSGSYTIITFTVQFVIDGTVVDTQTVNYGAAAIAPATDKVGYTFSGWDKDFSAVKSDLTVSGSYTANKYTVTFVVGAQGTTADKLVWEVDYGTAGSAITVPTVTPSGAAYEFTGWDKEVPATITEDITITAQFATTGSAVTVTFECGANGTIIGKNDAGETVKGSYSIAVPSGSKLGESFTTPTAIADENYTFIGWFIGDEEVDFNSVLEGDITITAKFAINAITITGFAKDAAGAAGIANGYLYVDVNDANADLSGIQMVTMYHTEDGRTYITITSAISVVEGADGAYIPMGIVTNNGYETFDVYLTNGLIDFSAADWNTVDIFTGAVINA